MLYDAPRAGAGGWQEFCVWPDADTGLGCLVASGSPFLSGRSKRAFEGAVAMLLFGGNANYINA
jgi:hypothetical protein